MIWGARQVGKSFLIEELFAKKYYPNRYLVIDCSVEDDFINELYKNHNPSHVLEFIEAKYNFKIDENTLLIFDEVQECLPIISLMKQFCEKYQHLHIIETGSFVRIKMNRIDKRHQKSFLFPVGKIDELFIYPLTFDEYLKNVNEQLYKKLLDSYNNGALLENGIKSLALSAFNKYLLVGGMPEVVQTSIDSKDNFYDVSAVIKSIYNNYLDNMDLYQTSKDSILRSKSIFKNIYSQLNKENKNFKVSNISKGLRNRDVISAIDWLENAQIIKKSQVLKQKITTPLIPDSESRLYRLYLMDMGIFSYQSGINASTFISSQNNELSGVFYENYVATELIARQFDLFYWKGKNNAEMEFVLDIDSKIIPIDCKKSRGSLNSLEKFRSVNKREIAIKISSNNYGFDKETDILTIPFYYFSFFLNEVKRENKIVIHS